jgi:ATP-dependent DNA ligase
MERKKRLQALLAKNKDQNMIQLAEHLDVAGSDVLKAACNLKLEGITSKRLSEPYVSAAPVSGPRRSAGPHSMPSSVAPIFAADPAQVGRALHYAKPESVAGFEMTSWTNDGVIRQASLQQVRERTDKTLRPDWTCQATSQVQHHETLDRPRRAHSTRHGVTS